MIRRRFLVLLAAALAGGCADAPKGGGRDARLAADVAARRQSLERVEAFGVHTDLMRVAADLLAGPQVPEWIPLEGWAVKEVELRVYRDWNTPVSEGSSVTPATDFARENHALHVVRGYADALRERGIHLVVVPVPRRIQVYPDRLPGVSVGADFAGADPGYARLLLALAEAGVEVVDLLPAFARSRERSGETDERLFLDYDHHWTPRGARLAAELVGGRVLALEAVERGPAVEGRDFVRSRERGAWTTVQVAREDGEWKAEDGSVVEGADGEVELWFERVLDPDGEPAVMKDRASPILLLADSFGGYYDGRSSDFGRLLFAETGHRIDPIILLGAGGRSAWKAVARRADDLAGKRVVVWLFSSRVLAHENLKVIPVFGD